MKILLICMAFAAMSLAMPIAEENTNVPAAPNKDEPQTTDSKQTADPVLEKKEVEKEPEPAGKSAPADISSDKEPVVAQPEATPDDKPEMKPVESKSDAPKTEQKSDKETSESEKKVENAESNSAATDSKLEEAKVDEISKEASGKSALVADTIDVDSALNEKQAVAEEPADLSGLMQTPQKKIDLPTAPKNDADATSETKSEKLPAADAKPSKTEETKTNAEKSAADAESLRIERDTVDDKIVPEGEKEKAKTEDEIKTVEKTIAIEKPTSVVKEEEKKSLEESNSANTPLESTKAIPAEPTKEVPAEATKEIPAEVTKEEEKAVVEAKEVDAKLPRETLPGDLASNDSDSPANASSSSEETSDSSEGKKEGNNKNSSEESQP